MTGLVGWIETGKNWWYGDGPLLHALQSHAFEDLEFPALIEEIGQANTEQQLREKVQRYNLDAAVKAINGIAGADPKAKQWAIEKIQSTEAFRQLIGPRFESGAVYADPLKGGWERYQTRLEMLVHSRETHVAALGSALHEQALAAAIGGDIDLRLSAISSVVEGVSMDPEQARNEALRALRACANQKLPAFTGPALSETFREALSHGALAHRAKELVTDLNNQSPELGTRLQELWSPILDRLDNEGWLRDEHIEDHGQLLKIYAAIKGLLEMYPQDGLVIAETASGIISQADTDLKQLSEEVENVPKKLLQWIHDLNPQGPIQRQTVQHLLLLMPDVFRQDTAVEGFSLILKGDDPAEIARLAMRAADRTIYPPAVIARVIADGARTDSAIERSAKTLVQNTPRYLKLQWIQELTTHFAGKKKPLIGGLVERVVTKLQESGRLPTDYSKQGDVHRALETAIAAYRRDHAFPTDAYATAIDLFLQGETKESFSKIMLRTYLDHQFAQKAPTVSNEDRQLFLEPLDLTLNLVNASKLNSKRAFVYIDQWVALTADLAAEGVKPERLSEVWYAHTDELADNVRALARGKEVSLRSNLQNSVKMAVKEVQLDLHSVGDKLKEDPFLIIEGIMVPTLVQWLGFMGHEVDFSEQVEEIRQQKDDPEVRKFLEGLSSVFVDTLYNDGVYTIEQLLSINVVRIPVAKVCGDLADGMTAVAEPPLNEQDLRKRNPFLDLVLSLVIDWNIDDPENPGSLKEEKKKLLRRETVDKSWPAWIQDQGIEKGAAFVTKKAGILQGYTLGKEIRTRAVHWYLRNKLYKEGYPHLFEGYDKVATPFRQIIDPAVAQIIENHSGESLHQVVDEVLSFYHSGPTYSEVEAARTQKREGISALRAELKYLEGIRPNTLDKDQRLERISRRNHLSKEIRSLESDINNIEEAMVREPVAKLKKGYTLGLAAIVREVAEKGDCASGYQTLVDTLLQTLTTLR